MHRTCDMIIYSLHLHNYRWGRAYTVKFKRNRLYNLQSIMHHLCKAEINFMRCLFLKTSSSCLAPRQSNFRMEIRHNGAKFGLSVDTCSWHFMIRVHHLFSTRPPPINQSVLQSPIFPLILFDILDSIVFHISAFKFQLLFYLYRYQVIQCQQTR